MGTRFQSSIFRSASGSVFGRRVGAGFPCGTGRRGPPRFRGKGWYDAQADKAAAASASRSGPVALSWPTIRTKLGCPSPDARNVHR